MKNIGGGLKELPKDNRDYSFGAFFKVDKIPTWDFLIGSSEILNQKDTDYCTAYSTCAASAIQENKTLNPSWSFAVSKMISNDTEVWGQNLRTACKVHVDYGALEYNPDYSLEKQNEDFLRNINNYPKEFFEQAVIHKKQAYFLMDSFKNTYDSIVSALWKFKDEKRAVITGMLWRRAWTGIEDGIIPSIAGPEGEFGHAFIFIGQKYIKDKPYLVAQLSNGEEIGDKGFYYFPKSIVNKECRYGNFMFLDMPNMDKEIIIKESQYYRMDFYGKVWDIIKKFLFL